MKRSLMDRSTQVLLPPLALTGNMLISMKHPQVGLLVCLVSEIFWFYSGLIAWRRSGQIGMFVTNVALGVITAYGVVNYWFLK